MSTRRAPRWAANRQSDQDTSKAARIAALYLSRNQLTDIPKTHIARAWGISRWTLDRDLAAMAEMQEYVRRLTRLLEEEI